MNTNEKLQRTELVRAQLKEIFQDLDGDPNVDQRWLSLARSDIQKGMMSLTRSIINPEDVF